LISGRVFECAGQAVSLLFELMFESKSKELEADYIAKITEKGGWHDIMDSYSVHFAIRDWQADRLRESREAALDPARRILCVQYDFQETRD
jgi:uncharacterized membrane protein